MPQKDRTILSIDFPQLDDYRERLHSAMEDYQSFLTTEKAVNTEKKAALAILQEIIIEVGADGVDVDGYRAAISTTTTRKLTKERLLERGVSPDIIEYATITTESSPSVRVSQIKKGD